MASKVIKGMSTRLGVSAVLIFSLFIVVVVAYAAYHCWTDVPFQLGAPFPSNFNF